MLKVNGLVFEIRGAETRDAILIDQVVRHNAYHLPPSMRDEMVLDIGGHIGGVALMCAQRGATVFTFEPERETYQLLLRNIARSPFKDRILPFNMGVGDSHLQKLYQDTKERGVASIHPETNYHLSTTYEWIGTVTLATVLEVMNKIDFLKLDCEGCEIEVIPDIPYHHKQIKRIGMELHQDDKQNQALLDILRPYYNIEPLSHIEFLATLKEEDAKP